MKKHFSVWMLLARSSLPGLAASCAAVAAVQAAGFFMAMNTSAYREVPTPEHALDAGCLGLTGLIGLCLTALLAVRCGSMTSPRTACTLDRLRISRKAFCGWHSLHAGLCFLICWAVQALTALTLCTLWTLRFDPAGTQTVFLAVWRSPYLYNLLPLFDWVRWLRNLLLCAALGCAAADLALRSRQGGRGWWLPVLLFLSVSAAARDLFYPVFLCVLCAISLCCTLGHMTAEDKDDEEA
ncbi:MAG: hypothetical protein IJ412_12605 [Oscillospiraceae bacterium]|nr:hypothetical protein [Oscillospiraceae bacterium]